MPSIPGAFWDRHARGDLGASRLMCDECCGPLRRSSLNPDQRHALCNGEPRNNIIAEQLLSPITPVPGAMSASRLASAA
jgi:hypothetical protein